MLKELEEKDFPTPVGILTLSKEQVFYNALQEKYFDIIQQAKKLLLHHVNMNQLQKMSFLKSVHTLLFQLP